MSTPWIVEPLTKVHDRGSFSCGVESLDRYLKTQATQDFNRGFANVYVLRAESPSAIRGYYTLSTLSIPIGAIDQETAHKFPRYQDVPAILLGRLAVSSEHQGCNLGRMLVHDAFARCLAIPVAWAVFVVDALDENAARFYERIGFRRFEDERNRLFLTRSSIVNAFNETG